MNLKRIKLISALICIFMASIWSVGYAEFETVIGDYKQGKYYDTQTVVSLDKYICVEKSAKWSNEEKTKATVKIVVQTNKKTQSSAPIYEENPSLGGGEQLLPFSCTVKDTINSDSKDGFMIISGSWQSNVVNSSISCSSNKTITWKINNNIKYGEKIDNEWPYITFDIELRKKDSAEGYINTNNITNKNSNNYKDNACEITVASKKFTVPSPWLYKEPLIQGTIWYDCILIKSNGSKSRINNKIEKVQGLELGYYSKKYDEIFSINKKYLGYKVQPGLIEGNVTNNVDIDNYNFSETYVVNLDSDNKEQTVHFVFEDGQPQKGTIRVATLRVSSSKPASIINAEDTQLNYVIPDIPKGTKKQIKKTTPNGNYKYEGYFVIKDSLVASFDYTKSSAQDHGPNVTVSVDDTSGKSMQNTVLFFYSDTTLNDTGVGLEIRHKDLKTGEYITPSIKTSWGDISELVAEYHAKIGTLESIQQGYNDLFDGGLTTEELATIFDNYIASFWQGSIKGVKSLNLTNPNYNNLSIHNFNNTPVLMAYKNDTEVDYVTAVPLDASLSEEEIQYVPSISDIEIMIRNQNAPTFFNGEIHNGDKIVLEFLYDSVNQVIFEHYDKETTPLEKISKTIIDDIKVPMEVPNESEVVRSVEIPTTVDPGYTFINETELDPEGKATQEFNESNNTIKVSNVDVNAGKVKVKLKYIKNKGITFIHKNIKGGPLIKPTVTIYQDKYGNDISYDYKIPGYTYDSAESEGNMYTPEIVGNNLIIHNVTQDNTITLYYKANGEATVYHLGDGEYLTDEPEKLDAPIGQETETKALEPDSNGVICDKGDYVYIYNGEYSVNPSDVFFNHNEDKSIVTIKTTESHNNPIVEYKYQKKYPVIIHYLRQGTVLDDWTALDYENGIKSPDVFYLDPNESKEYEREILAGWIYTGYKVKSFEHPSWFASEETKVTVKGDYKNIIIFYYNRDPELTVRTIFGHFWPQTPEDDDSNPNLPYPITLVLDEDFGVEYLITGFNEIQYKTQISVKFPFEVYHSGEFIARDQEIVLNTFEKKENNPAEFIEIVKFRLPSWVKEKQLYEATLTLKYIDMPLENEIEPGKTEHTFKPQKIIFNVIGKLYDFSINAIKEGVSADMAKWTTSLFGKLGNLEDNTNREYKADTLPIGQRKVTPNVSTGEYQTSTYHTKEEINTQNPTWSYGMAYDTPFSFSIKTKGLDSDRIVITPKLEYLDIDGNKPTTYQVEFRYKLVDGTEKVFAGTDGKIIVDTGSFETSLSKRFEDKLKEIQDEVNKANELKKKGDYLANSSKEGYANVKNDYKNFLHSKNVNIGNYSQIVLTKDLRVPYVNYNGNDLKYSEVQKIGNLFEKGRYDDLQFRKDNDNEVGLNYITVDNNSQYNQDIYNKKLTQKSDGTLNGVNMNYDAVINSLGHWYGEYSLPSSLRVVKLEGPIGQELKNGYIILSFEIHTVKEGDEVGVPYLVYYNNDWTKNGSQWNVENNSMNESESSYNKVKVKLPNELKQPAEKEIDISDGYYPVAIFNAGFSIKDFYGVVGNN